MSRILQGMRSFLMPNFVWHSGRCKGYICSYWRLLYGVLPRQNAELGTAQAISVFGR